MQKTVLVPVANGTEELEAVAIIDVLRRAGATVTVASVTGARQITASRGVVIVADALIEACVQKEYDLVVLPGGITGAEHLRDSAELIGILKHQREKERLYGGDLRQPGRGTRIPWTLSGAPGHLPPGLCRSADNKGSDQGPRGNGRQLPHQPWPWNRCRVCFGFGGAALRQGQT